MALTFLEIEEDRFQLNMNALGSGEQQTAASSGIDMLVRRPLRGLQHAVNQYASLRVLRDDGTPVPLLNSSKTSDKALMTANFILQRVTEPRTEKMQILETFGAPYAFFFGERARFLSFSAMLVNTPDFNWLSEWMENYEHVFRGTKLVELGARIYLEFDSITVEGYMTGTSNIRSSSDPLYAPVDFTMWVTWYQDLSQVGGTAFPGATAVDSSGSAMSSDRERGRFSDNVDEYLVRYEAPRESAKPAGVSSPEETYLAAGTSIDAELARVSIDADDPSELFAGEECLDIADVGLISADGSMDNMDDHGIIPLEDTTMVADSTEPSTSEVGLTGGPDTAVLGSSHTDVPAI